MKRDSDISVARPMIAAECTLSVVVDDLSLGFPL